MGFVPVMHLQLLTLFSRGDSDAGLLQAVHVISAKSWIHYMKSVLPMLDPFSDEGQQHTVLLVALSKERADMVVRTNGGTGEMYRRVCHSDLSLLPGCSD